MTCYSPLQGWLSQKLSKTGKRKITFVLKEGFVDRPMSVPCGQCFGCREKRAQDWAVRIVHEASLHEKNCFITLTYDNDHLPTGGTLVKKHMQDFMKRLRFKYSDREIRFYGCGEYGDKYGRPHYHIILFNHDFDDKYLFYERNGNKYYRSKSLDGRFENSTVLDPDVYGLWTFGQCDISEVTFNSARYTARYCTKKITGDKAKDAYIRVNEITGECYEVLPEFSLMSRRKGIGKDWIETFSSDVYPQDKVVVADKHLVSPPRYYDKRFELDNPDGFAKVKEIREVNGFKYRSSDEASLWRLEVKEKVKKAKINRLASRDNL